jgi:aminocarboxymuconate-semialdehyde decarboxylase
VINTPTAFLQDADGDVPKGTIPRINDEVANLVAKNPGKLHGLATVDAFGGDDAARELTRAVRELGLRGVFIESAKGDLLPNAKEARPTLAAAAALGVPVFIHPITDPQLHARFRKTGRQGVRLARATINSLALISLLEGGVFDELPKLRVVVTTLAIGGVLMAGGFGDGMQIRRDTPELARRHIYIDTMGIHPALVASMVELLGADHVIAGTDWPIVVEKDVPARLQKALTFAGLSAEQQQMVAGGNTLKLLGLG